MPPKVRPGFLLLLVTELLAGVLELAVEGLVVRVGVCCSVAPHVVFLLKVTTRAEECIMGTKVSAASPKTVPKEVFHIEEIIVL